MNIKLDGGLAQLTYKKGKRNYNKTITITSLTEALISDKGISTPLLPPGCRFYNKNGQSHSLILEIPPRITHVQYVNSSGKDIFKGDVPLPWGVMSMNFKEQSDGKYRFNKDIEIYALKHPIFTKEDDIFYYPLPNIYESNRICWGGSMDREDYIIDSITQAGRFVDAFINSKFNTDLHPRINKFERFEDLIRTIEGKNTFPQDILVRSGSINRIMRGASV